MYFLMSDSNRVQYISHLSRIDRCCADLITEFFNGLCAYSVCIIVKYKLSTTSGKGADESATNNGAFFLVIEHRGTRHETSNVLP